MIQKRCIVLIDGSNFYFKLKDLSLHHLLDFDFTAFIASLIGDAQLVAATYYVGKIRTDGTQRTQAIFDHQQKLLSHLKRHGCGYSLGYLLKSDDRFHEKGVDVNMAVDMLVAAYENTFDHILLVSSDTDLIPAIRKAKEKGKTVGYVGFSHKPSVAMVATCTTSRLLTKEDLLPCVMPKKSCK